MNRDEVMTFVKKSLSFLPDKSYIKLYFFSNTKYLIIKLQLY